MTRLWKLRLLICLLISLASGSLALADLYFPQTAVGSAGNLTILTRFTITRAASGNPTVLISFYDNDGHPWTLDVSCAEQPELNGSWSSRSFVFEGRTAATIMVSANTGVAAGWTCISTQTRLTVSSSYVAMEQDPSGGQGAPWKPLWEAGVLPSPSANQFFFAADNKTDRVVRSTGLAMSNPGSVDTQVTVKLYDAAGTTLSTKYVQLPSHGHTALFLSQIFADVNMDNFIGWVELTSRVAITAAALQGSAGAGATVYSAIPVTPNRQDAAYTMVYDTEENDTFEHRQFFMLPAQIQGSALSSAGASAADTDYYAIAASSGQMIEVTVLTDAIGSQLEPVVELFDMGMHLLATAAPMSAETDDKTLLYTVTNSANYVVRISSTSGGTHLAYRAYLTTE